MLKIAHMDVPKWQQSLIAEKTKNLNVENLFFEEVNFTPEIINQIKDCQIITVFVHTTTDQETIDLLPNLKLVITRSTGFDHINCSYLDKRCVEFKSVPTYGVDTVAEHAFALILSIVKNITSIDNRTTIGNFKYIDKIGFDLVGKTLGVLGAGRIGQSLLQIGKGFKMNMIAFDSYQNLEASKQIGFEYHDVDYVLANSDILSLHLPLNEDSQRILSLENLRKIKKGAVLINTARGDLISNENLNIILEEKVISALGADCIEDEKKMYKYGPNQEQSKLLSKENVTFTPHNAYYTREAVDRILTTTVEHIQNFSEANS
jgi:D-lactate dehydrogenase